MGAGAGAGASLGDGGVVALWAVPQLAQNRAPGLSSSPQDEQNAPAGLATGTGMGAPQLSQNLLPSGFSELHFGQVISIILMNSEAHKRSHDNRPQQRPDHAGADCADDHQDHRVAGIASQRVFD